jgi:hypothetical protein
MRAAAAGPGRAAEAVGNNDGKPAKLRQAHDRGIAARGSLTAVS